MQILATSTSKSAPTPSVLNDFDFQIALSRRRGANFADFIFQRCSEPLSFNDFNLQIALAPRRGPHLEQPILRARPFLGADFPSQRSHKTMEKHSVSRTSYPPNPHVSHLCCITSARSHLLIDRSSAATFSIVGS